MLHPEILWAVTVFLFLLAASALVGLATGVLAVHIVVTQHGQISLRVNFALILLAALEAFLIAQNPGAWPILLGFFLLVATAMALVDLAVIFGLDSPWPGPRARRLALALIPTGLVSIGLMISGLFKYGIALNPDAVSLLEPLGWFFALLTMVALFDLTVRIIGRKVNRGARVG